MPAATAPSKAGASEPVASSRA